MITRSQASAKNSITGKRKKGDHCAALEDGDGRNRRRLQSSRETSGQGKARHSSAGTKVAEGVCSPSRKRRKSVKSPQYDGASNKQTHESSDQEMTNCCPAGTEIAEVPCAARPTCREDVDEIPLGSPDRTSTTTVSPKFQGPILALPAISAATAASKKQSKRGSAQDKSIEHCSSLTDGNGVQPHEGHSCEQFVAICEEPTQHSENPREIAENANLPPKLTDTQCRQEKGYPHEATPSLTQKGAEKRSCTASMKRKRVRLQSNSTDKRKQLKNVRSPNSVSTPMKSRKPNVKGIRAAESRWKHLIQSIFRAKFAPDSTTVDNKLPHSGVERKMSAENSQSDETQSLRKKRKRLVGHDNTSAARRRPKVRRQQQKIGKQLRSLLRWIKTWLIQAKFSQSTNSQSSNDMGETFIMTEDERNAFAKTMVKSCQQNENLRTLFLESVRILTMSGLMNAAASTLLQEEACEQAQTLMDAWAEAKEQNDVAGSLPMNFLKAVNQLHEMKGDLSTKLTSSEDSFGLKRLDEKAWKLKLPILPEPKPTVPKNLG